MTAAEVTPTATGGEARRLTEWVFRVRELGIVGACALHMVFTPVM
jgi:hypothetical protein